MNFYQIRQNKNKKDSGGYGIKLEMFGTITKIKESKLSSNNKPMTKCEVADDNNEAHSVTFFGDMQPAVNMIGQRFAMSISCEDYRLQDGRVVEVYQGFLRSGNVSQNAQQNTPQTLQNAPQSTNGSNSDIRIEATRLAAQAIGGTGVDVAQEIAVKLIDLAGLLMPWLESGQPPTFAAPQPKTFEEQYDIPPED